MLTLLLLPALAAAPKDCKDDVPCLLAAAKECSPAVYRYHGPVRTMGAQTTAWITLTVHGPKKNTCEFETETVIDQLKLDDDLVSLFRPDAGADETRALMAEMEKAARSAPQLHMTCLLEKATAAEWVDLNQPTQKTMHATFDDPFATCIPTNCGPKPVLAKGCAFTGCGQGGWHVKCGKPPVECALGVQPLLTPNCHSECELPYHADGKRYGTPEPSTSCP